MCERASRPKQRTGGLQGGPRVAASDEAGAMKPPPLAADGACVWYCGPQHAASGTSGSTTCPLATCQSACVSPAPLPPHRDCFPEEWPTLQRWTNAAPMMIIGSHDWNTPGIDGARAGCQLPSQPAACTWCLAPRAHMLPTVMLLSFLETAKSVPHLLSPWPRGRCFSCPRQAQVRW